MEVLGYYVHKDDKELNSVSVMVVIETGGKRLECYSPTGQHHECDRDYFKECRKITKEEYIKASVGLYTPSDYMI